MSGEKKGPYTINERLAAEIEKIRSYVKAMEQHISFLKEDRDFWRQEANSLLDIISDSQLPSQTSARRSLSTQRSRFEVIRNQPAPKF